MSGAITPEALARQEEGFARAFAAGDIELARGLYHPEVVYVSPTVRLFDWPTPIEGVERTLEFIALTIRDCRNIVYSAVERAPLPGGSFVRVHFDWDVRKGLRLRSNYVVLYRYREGRIGRQELYYDPSARPEQIQPRPHVPH
jgi:ketosteroid isomerase-like protein